MDQLNLAPPGAEGTSERVMRDFTRTPLRCRRGEHVVDFVIHDDGPATSWAVQCEVGSVVWV